MIGRVQSDRHTRLQFTVQNTEVRITSQCYQSYY